ncbi:hypothetical protein OH76DRAFT_1179649 [Lentinus brumalis]|uniref:Uncharacterized protein n=1 Tax=Lentinus brumalis TaxID=2498619 RepID=A0A371CTW3_9APHY|nr:hypothetical protein OH76DRAFT_1179649 [Polyporus brumalis]
MICGEVLSNIRDTADRRASRWRFSLMAFPACSTSTGGGRPTDRDQILSPADKPIEISGAGPSAVVCSSWCVLLAIYIDTLKCDAGIRAPWTDGRKASDNQEAPSRSPAHCIDDTVERNFDTGVP